MKRWQDNIYFVLVEPKEPGNIGASARAIKNMGFKNLCIVRPRHDFFDEARCLAHNALDVLEKATIHDSLEDALKDKSFVVGTSRRRGRRRGLVLPVEQGVKRFYEAAHENKIAILFGREDRGLFNEEVEECGLLLSIPTGREQPSLNLAQAVLVVGYELLKLDSARRKEGRPVPKCSVVNQEELSFLYERVSHVLKVLGYIPRGDLDLEMKIMSNVKHIAGRTGLMEWELQMFHGIISQIEKKLE